jgi:hypothetical protein
MSVTIDECAISATREKLKLSSESGDFGSKKCKRGYGGAYVRSGGVCVWWQSRVWSQAVAFV